MKRVVCVVAVAAMAACARSASPPQSVATPTAVASESPFVQTATPAPTVEAVRVVSGVVGFESPSRNIRCDVFGRNDAGYSVARCEATSHVWTVPPRPTNGGCTGDWYGRLIIDEDRAFFGCSSEALATGAVLPYAHALRDGSILCESSEQGVKCTSQITGHGFALSKQVYTLY